MIIGVVGAAGSGKSTFAARLCAQHAFTEYSFAKPLKDLCAQMFGWDRSRLDELAYKEEQDPELPTGWTRRRVLQHLGTEGFREIDPDFWVKLGKKALGTGDYVVPDVRFTNEAAAIKELGGFIVRIERSDFAGTASKQHASEQEWQKIEVDLVVRPQNGVPNVQKAADAAVAFFETSYQFSALVLSADQVVKSVWVEKRAEPRISGETLQAAHVAERRVSGTPNRRVRNGGIAGSRAGGTGRRTNDSYWPDLPKERRVFVRRAVPYPTVGGGQRIDWGRRENDTYEGFGPYPGGRLVTISELRKSHP